MTSAPAAIPDLKATLPTSLPKSSTIPIEPLAFNTGLKSSSICLALLIAVSNPRLYTCKSPSIVLGIPKLIGQYGNSLPAVLVGIPKTMDGDLQVYSLGLDTAINRARQILEDFKPVLKANGSIGIVELFGRDVGRVAFKSGIAAGADVILIPEVEIDWDYTCNFIADRYDNRARSNNGVSYVLIAVAEGTGHPITHRQVYQNNGADSFGHGKLGDVGQVLAKLIYDRFKDDPRIMQHTRKPDIKTQKPSYDVRGGETLYSD